MTCHFSFNRSAAAKILMAACIVSLFAGCRMVHTAGFEKTNNIGVESNLWREELAGARIGVAIYTNAIYNMPEIGGKPKLVGPKSSSRMSVEPNDSKRSSFNTWNTVSSLLLGLTPSPFSRLANGAGWNPETTIEGNPLSFPVKDLNDAIYAGAKSAFEGFGAEVSRFDESQTGGISMGHLAHGNRDSIDYLFVVRHFYRVEKIRGKARYVSEVRASLFDTQKRNRVGWIFGKKDQRRWMKYRRLIASPVVPIASQTKIPRGKKEPVFCLQFSENSILQVKMQIAKTLKLDLTDWPHKDIEKHAAQRQGVPAPWLR